MPNARGVCGDAECGGAADKVEPSARGNLGGAHIDNRFFVRGNGMKDLPSDSNVLNTMQEMLQDLGDRQRRAEERLSEQIARVGVKLDEAMCKTHCGWRDCPEIPLQAKALDHLLEVAPVSANPSARSHGKKEKEKHQNNGTEASDSTKAPNNRCTSASVWSQKKPNGEEGDEHEPKEKGKSDIKKRRTSVAKVLEDIAASAPGAPPAAPTLPESHTLLERLVRNPKFDMGIASVVMVNSILIGLKIDEEALGVEPYDGYTYIEYCCSAVFAMELFVRLIVNQKYFLCGPQKYWAFFDCILVAMSIFEVILVVSIGGAKGLGNAAPMAKALKIARMARIFRIFRMCRFLTKIRLMAAMIVGTLSSLIWLFILCVGIMYVFAIIMTQGAADVIHTDEWGFAREEKEAIEGEFGSLARSMYTLFKGMTGGVSWGEPGAVAMKLGDIYFFVYVVFISFVFFSVLNIVTGAASKEEIPFLLHGKIGRLTRPIMRPHRASPWLNTQCCYSIRARCGCATKSAKMSFLRSQQLPITLLILNLSRSCVSSMLKLIALSRCANWVTMWALRTCRSRRGIRRTSALLVFMKRLRNFLQQTQRYCLLCRHGPFS
eukprot:TRINITY_DN8608_c0_g1_i1.p1 TRINITY_DN8608_c0_g1~~TRINITY_DN8608_c0_g1_i1.p1  ORF type:complete len:625 (-),score=112.80 TRINITY_DN8608_c0_g1_i1:359-2170(-)